MFAMTSGCRRDARASFLLWGTWRVMHSEVEACKQLVNEMGWLES